MLPHRKSCAACKRARRQAALNAMPGIRPGEIHTPWHEFWRRFRRQPVAMGAGIFAPLLGDISGKTVLDMCSAPGGKGTQLAAQMRGEGVLFLNEINFSRAKILSQNTERMGIKNAVVTVAPPEKLARQAKDSPVNQLVAPRQRQPVSSQFTTRQDKRNDDQNKEHDKAQMIILAQ